MYKSKSICPATSAQAKEPDEALFSRVAAILDDARANTVRSVNRNMVVAYWMIGRETVLELQRGDDRADYGERVIRNLSKRLATARGRGYSEQNLRNFRQFYSIFADRANKGPEEKCYTSCSESIPDFQQELSWSHYRLLMRIADDAARDFYERESVRSGWNVRALERQIQTRCHERLLSTRERSHMSTGRAADVTKSRAFDDGGTTQTVGNDGISHLDILKDPLVLDFLDLPDPAPMHEAGMESAIIAHLKEFLLELGRGFAFVARQKRLSFEDEHLYVDLVFYNIPLRCYLLIDLKMGKLTHADVGQMDGYVRLFDDLIATADDNPTIGLILCTEKNAAVARYSVLNDRNQIFASRYVTTLPTEAELAVEITRERRLIEARTGKGQK